MMEKVQTYLGGSSGCENDLCQLSGMPSKRNLLSIGVHATFPSDHSMGEILSLLSAKCLKAALSSVDFVEILSDMPTLKLILLVC